MFVTIMAVLFALFVAYKLMISVNRKKAAEAFVRGYYCESPDALYRLVNEFSYPAFTSLNVSAVLLGRLLAKEVPTLDADSVSVAFAEHWNNDHILIRAQQLDRMIKHAGKESALIGLSDELAALY